MKKILFIFFATQANITFSQTELEKLVSNRICSCLEKAKDVTQDNFIYCLEQSMADNYELIKKGIDELKDTAEDAAYNYGRKIADKIQPQLVFTCKAYFDMVENMRNSTLKRYNIDSLKKEQEYLTTITETKRDASFFLKRGIIFFLLEEYDNALEDFNRILKNQPSSLQPLLLKAWILEKQELFDESVILYNKLLLLTKKNEYKIFSAMARRKKELKKL